jgi:hypothetical protein
MQHFLKRLLAALRPSRKARPSLRRVIPIRLNVETMEERMALSGSPLPIHAPVFAPALVGSVVPQADAGTGGPGIALPEKPVYGYKHRRRWPLAVQASPATEFVAPAPQAVASAVQHPAAVAGTAAHLAVGGADGILIVVSAEHFIVHPPEGPLPTEGLANAR